METEEKVIATKENADSERSKKTFQIIVFKLGNEEYALSIEQIKEVIITPNISRIPLTASHIKGVANIRGNVLAIIDLAERFGVSNDSSGNSTPPKYTLVVASEEYKMGILVKEVPSTLRVSEADIDVSPNIIQDNTLDNNYIKGIVKSGTRMIVLIDIFRVITKEDKELISKTH